MLPEGNPFKRTFQPAIGKTEVRPGEVAANAENVPGKFNACKALLEGAVSCGAQEATQKNRRLKQVFIALQQLVQVATELLGSGGRTPEDFPAGLERGCPGSDLCPLARWRLGLGQGWSRSPHCR